MAEADKVVVGKGFTVEIAGHGFLPIKEVRGGENLATVGHSTISELELVAFVTPNQKHFADIAKKISTSGEPYRVNIKVTRHFQGKNTPKTFNYFDCLITSYDYAKFEAGSGELMTETATFKPTRVEIA